LKKKTFNFTYLQELDVKSYKLIFVKKKVIYINKSLV